MRRIVAVVLGFLLLAGCAAAPAKLVASAVETATAETGTEKAQTDVLDQFVAFGADTAGGSLKTAKAAAVLVEYLSVSDLEVDVMTDWRAGLTDDQRELLDLNWPGILSEAQAIAADPAGQADELASAGVETDFGSMELGGVPDKLVTVNTALTGKAG